MIRNVLLVAALLGTLASCDEMNMKIADLKPIPDIAYSKGVSAPFCGMAGNVLVVAGGANFPDKSLIDGGAKRVYADIWAMDLLSGEWSRAGELPDSVAYGATFQVGDALILAGGNVRGEASRKVYELKMVEGKAVLRSLPDLPEPMEQCGWTSDEGRLYMVGGVGVKGIYSCQSGVYEWEKIADLPEPLVQPVAFASSGKLFVWGGFNPETLEVSNKGIVLDSSWKEGPSIPDSGTFVGSTGVTLPDGRLAVVGGVNRTVFAKALHNTPEDRIPYLSKEPSEYQFRKELLIFDPRDCSWTSPGSAPELALAGPGVAVAPDGSLFVAGGELKPGVRSPRIFSCRW